MQKFFEHEILVDRLLNLFWQLLENASVLVIFESHVLVVGPLVVEKGLYFAFKLQVEWDLIVEFPQGTEEFGKVVAIF